MKNRNDLIKQGTKGQETTTVKPEEEGKERKDMTEEKKKDVKKASPAKEKINQAVADLKKLMEETMKKLAALVPGVEVVPRKKYTGYKVQGRLISSIMGKKLSFDVSIHEYSEKGTHTGTEHFEIKSGGKDVGAVITGLLTQVKKNCDILNAAATKPKKKEASKPAPEKETKGEEKKESAPAK